MLIFGTLIVALLALFQLSKYAMTSRNLKNEFVLAGIAIVFFIIGIYLNQRSLRKTQITPNSGENNTAKIAQLRISKREYEILVEIS